MLCCAKSKEAFVCEVVLLDGSHLTFSRNQNIKLSTKVNAIFNTVCQNINLVEKDYFGIKFLDEGSRSHWLELDKGLGDDPEFVKVSTSTSTPVLHFGVKYYAADPCSLKEEVTRYQFFLQLKQDILQARLACSWRRSAELSALALQSEIGDYSPNEHKRGYVSEFRFIPHQDEQFESEVSRLHATYSGLVPSSAELQYLKKCRQLDLYGVELHNVKGERGVQYQLGVSPRGVETFRNKRRVTVFYWPQITLVNYREQYLELKVRNKQGDVTSHKFEVMTSLLCKYVWKSIADHHVFYRLPQHTQASAWNKKYRYSGRTEAEVMQSEVEREEPEVARISSKRFPPRDNNNQQQATSRGTRKSSARSDAENLQPVNRGDDGGDGGESTWEEALHKNSMFRVSEKEKNVKYVTPKSERKERQRRLQTLSDNENRQRRHRSRTGRSSGEESDSPSKRRIRARQRRNRNQRAGSDVSEAPSMQRHHRRTNYHTDTEMLRRDSEPRVPAHNTPTSPAHSEARSRRLKRLSREDELARQQLWQHIRKEVVDVTSSPELVGDISYTEVKTVGNPNPAPQRSNRHRGNRSRRSSKRASGTSQLSSIAPPPRDEMVAPLRVTTTVVHEHQRSDPPWKHPHPSKLDWDTRTPSLSNEDLSNQHRNNRKPRSSDLKLIYTQI